MTLLYARRFIDPNNQYRRWIDPRVHALRLGEVISYLLHKGWTELPPDRPGYRAFREPTGEIVAGKPLCQFVPDTEENDLPLRLFELLTGLAEFEDRPASAVIDDILQCAHVQQANGPARDQTQQPESSPS